MVTWDVEKQRRHRNFISAQSAYGVITVESNFKRVAKFCEFGNRYCKRPEEKQTDVVFATTVLGDAIQQRVDRVILITADSDQVPLARQMKALFPGIAMTLSAPPGRADHARELGAEIVDRTPLDSSRLLAHRLPMEVKGANDKVVARMPEIYLATDTPTKMINGAPG